MVQLKERIDSPAIAAEVLVAQLKAKFPSIVTKVRPELLADEDIGVEIRAPKDIWKRVGEEAAMLSLQIELETGFFVLPFVYPQESK
ncbi:MAG: hypothetical protein RMK89_03895 [Armatimonadota bacterium]|nr:hypothetical protein [Armatimonadota bacterium]MDW8142587.1 hypothetical protein [Armatimonadota bacterium]